MEARFGVVEYGVEASSGAPGGLGTGWRGRRVLWRGGLRAGARARGEGEGEGEGPRGEGEGGAEWRRAWAGLSRERHR